MLKKIELEIKLINDNIDKMYVDKLSGKISEQIFERVLNKLTDDSKQKEQEDADIKEMQENAGMDEKDNVNDLIKEFLKLEKPTPELMKVIINRIEVHQNKQVDIKFNFKSLNFFIKTESGLLWHLAEAISMSDRVIVLTKRPGTINKIHEIKFDIKDRTPLNSRESPEFSRYFNTLWKELSVNDIRR